MATLANDIEDTTEQDIEAAFGGNFSDEEDSSGDESEAEVGEASGSVDVTSESCKKRRKTGESQYVSSGNTAIAGNTTSSSVVTIVDSGDEINVEEEFDDDAEELERRTKLAVMELRRQRQADPSDVVVVGDEDSDDEGEEIQILETTTSSSTPSFSYPTIFPSTSAREEGVDNIFETAAVQAAATVSNSMVVNVQMLAGEKEAFPVKMKKEETIKELQAKIAAHLGCRCNKIVLSFEGENLTRRGTATVMSLLEDDSDYDDDDDDDGPMVQIECKRKD